MVSSRLAGRASFKGDFAAQQSLSSKIDLRRFQKPKAAIGGHCDILPKGGWRPPPTKPGQIRPDGNFQSRLADSLTGYLP
jgi:hypothetical protein